jgi:biopolymer transport protein ExbB
MKPQNFFQIVMLLITCLFLIPCTGFADETAVASHATLWNLLKAGGWTMVVLGLLSVAALTLIFYNFLTLKIESLVPTEFTENLIMRLEAHDLQGAKIICDKKKNIITAIALSGINRLSRGKIVIREAMEKTMQKEISKLWKSISFLGDIASIAPLLGLLGTVVGMIQAFNVISTAGENLKPIMLVGGISKSLITTAAGLVIAIPTLAFYSYFRGIVQDICDLVDDYSTDIIKLIEEASPLSSKLQPPLQSAAPSLSREGEIPEVFSHA